MLIVTQIATWVHLQNKVCESAWNKREGKVRSFVEERLQRLTPGPLEYVSAPAPTSLPVGHRGDFVESDLQTVWLVSSVVMASYRANGSTHPHENQQRDMWCMYIFNFVCSRVFGARVSLCSRNQSLLKWIRLKN